MAKSTLLDFGSDFQSKQNLNANNTLIETAFENTLSRDGTSPNYMMAPLDMNSNRILNLPTPSSDLEPVRLIDLNGSPINIAVSSYGLVRSIFSILDATDIAFINGGENSHDIQGKVQTAMNANPNSAWFFPHGWYFFNNAVSLPAGIRWIGEGIGKTNIKCGGGPYGIYQHNPNGTTTVQGFRAEQITFYFSSSGIQWNSDTGGYDDTLATQYYISNWGLDQCQILLNSAAGSQVGCQANKCFNGGITKSYFNSFGVQIYLRGCDLNYITHNRMDNANDTAVEVLSFGTFGSTNKVDHNDINNPRNRFYYGNDRDGIFTNNHCELDGPPGFPSGSPGSDGTAGVNQAAAVEIIATGSAFKTLIANNRFEVDVYADRWLKYRSGNPYSLIAEGNGSTGPGSAYADIPSLPYWTNSSTRMVCSHRNNINLDGDNRFPMNFETGAGDPKSGINVVAHLTPSRPGVKCVGIGNLLMCDSGAFRLAADANTGKYIEFSDWASLATPGGVLKGTFTISWISYGSVAGQVMSWEARDNGVLVVGGTFAHAATNTLYFTQPAAITATTNLSLRFWNADTTRNGNVYIQSVDIRL